jgi:GNAT superfamily N-acetyltransferase
VVDLPYRLSSWALDDRRNTNLWFDEAGNLIAWAVIQSPFWQVDIVCQPEMESALFPQILDWVDKRVHELAGSPWYREAWYVNAFDDQHERTAAFEAAGYTCQSDVGEDSWSKVLMRRSDHALPRSYPPPAGFIARPLRGGGEVPAYVDLHREVFESRNMTVEWRQRTLLQPDYHPELDIVVQTPDGQLGAFCVGWLSRSPAGEWVGHVEPLGCHPDFRRYALGRVALAEVLQRLLQAGAASIYVETDNYRNTAFRLYKSFDFQVAQNVKVFGREYPLPAATS